MFKFVTSYVHGSQIGVLVELETDDDFTANTDECQALARDLAMQIAAMNPSDIHAADLSNVVSLSGELNLAQEPDGALMNQPFVKDPSVTVAQRIEEIANTLRATIRVRRFVRFDANAL